VQFRLRRADRKRTTNWVTHDSDVTRPHAHDCDVVDLVDATATDNRSGG
jgi:hypothetical protein